MYLSVRVWLVGSISLPHVPIELGDNSVCSQLGSIDSCCSMVSSIPSATLSVPPIHTNIEPFQQHHRPSRSRRIALLNAHKGTFFPMPSWDRPALRLKGEAVVQTCTSCIGAITHLFRIVLYPPQAGDGPYKVYYGAHLHIGAQIAVASVCQTLVL